MQQASHVSQSINLLLLPPQQRNEKIERVILTPGPVQKGRQRKKKKEEAIEREYRTAPNIPASHNQITYIHTIFFGCLIKSLLLNALIWPKGIHSGIGPGWQ